MLLLLPLDQEQEKEDLVSYVPRLNDRIFAGHFIQGNCPPPLMVSYACRHWNEREWLLPLNASVICKDINVICIGPGLKKSLYQEESLLLLSFLIAFPIAVLTSVSFVLTTEEEEGFQCLPSQYNQMLLNI